MTLPMAGWTVGLAFTLAAAWKRGKCTPCHNGRRSVREKHTVRNQPFGLK